MDPQSLDTLRELRALLDAGTISLAEFEALKQKLIFGAAPTPPMPPAAAPAAPVPPVSEAAAPPVGARFVAPDFAAPDDDQPEPPAPRNYLNLALSIGGLLALLALVLYLNSNRPNEGLTSKTQVAADSTAIETGPQALPLPPRPTPAAPETVRVQPTNPAPPIVRPAAPAATDTSAALPADTLAP